jgi:hypothetical protein
MYDDFDGNRKQIEKQKATEHSSFCELRAERAGARLTSFV